MQGFVRDHHTLYPWERKTARIVEKYNISMEPIKLATKARLKFTWALTHLCTDSERNSTTRRSIKLPVK